jgi:PAS domain S-box-containing protein
MSDSDAPADALDFLRGGGEMGALIARFDWAATPVGDIDAWPERLKGVISTLLQSPVPMSLWWGPTGVMLYNDAHARLLGDRHPKALGRSVREVRPDRISIVDQIISAGLAGQTVSLCALASKIQRSGRQEEAWFDLDCSPVRDERGEPAGVLIVSVDITQRVLAERKAARKLERQRAMFEQAPGFICLLSGPDLTVEFTNAAHRRLFGVHDAEGRPYMEAFAEIAARGEPEILHQVYQSGTPYVGRAYPVVIPKPGGDEEHLLDLVLVPVRDDDGHVQGLFFEGFDVTEQVRAQRAEEASNRRLGAALALARLGAFEWDGETETMTLDARACEIFGFGPDEHVTRDALVARIDEQDFVRVEAESAAADAAGRRRREYEFRIRLPDGSVRRIASVSDSSFAPNKRSSHFIGVFDDVTERRAAERRQRMLINELNHRVKNTLATVQSIAAQTLRAAPTVATAREVFESRLVALASAHDLLTAQGWRGARLADVAATAMAPFESAGRPQIVRSGADVWLSAQQALALNLALHELATNAAKYGALSTAMGRVRLSWTSCAGELKLLWVEEDGPPVAERAHAGFGARLLQRSLARELGGQVDWTFPPEGARCEIRCKVEQVSAASPLEIAEAAGLRFNF